MTIEELIVYGKKYLHSNEAKMLLASILELDTLELLNHLDDNVSEEKIDIYKRCIQARLNNEPLQYIIGNVNFYGYIFKIDRHVLIPRFETEELVENTLIKIDEIFPSDKLNIIDLGCGSGVIGITLKKKNANFNVTCLDISSDALRITEENSRSLNADVNIVAGDMLDGISDKYDVIISNPPYIKTDEEIEDIVKNNEPHLALYAGVDGLDCYRKIFKNVAKNLNDPYLIALEIGESEREDIKTLAENYLKDFIFECKKDLAGRDRMVFIYKK